ncbi:MAG: translation elongation factor Ts [Thiotrichales bacterium 32-46-8]|nr:translation elongation factor Ts [Gammaproteobacteria bacterium]OYX07924.1 MAG: translation elongation factor Ts [Thiotrichales bacterium 32-46-8]OYY24617.1 MAG: translation elongation factor Ts [Thiotrichales bacterium 35-46-9]OYZ08023.1 MAG: translation elongation factor Ts [Thiotrichales bacterium 16-46-22]OZA18641.1 MAG: translation elongation factor Ts [Thiotrichales bacterium 17-46-47]OZA75230.1 MAG: translation elongation factor Ts [Thiotrichales bacterium 39-47-5]OZA97177.1 MAG: tr
MAITAGMVKELRERTGVGMMECKGALTETGGDMEKAVDLLRAKGMAKADKKAGRTAAEGTIAIVMSSDKKRAAIVEANCETDFVGKSDEFNEFANAAAQAALDSNATDIDSLLAAKMTDGKTVDERRRELIAKIGENMSIRRFEIIETTGAIGTYRHGDKIGVVVNLEGGDEAFGKDLAMHVAASRPLAIDASGVDAETIERERAIAQTKADESGKPANIVEKMVEGAIRKFMEEVTLLSQPFVKDPDTTVGNLLKKNNVTVKHFVRLEVGEGIVKETVDFAAEVAATAAAMQGK